MRKLQGSSRISVIGQDHRIVSPAPQVNQQTDPAQINAEGTFPRLAVLRLGLEKYWLISGLFRRMGPL